MKNTKKIICIPYLLKIWRCNEKYKKIICIHYLLKIWRCNEKYKKNNLHFVCDSHTKVKKLLNKDMDVTKKSLINDLYNAFLVTVGVVSVSMVSKKLTKDSLGVTSTLPGIAKLSVAIGISAVGVKMLQEKGYLPDVIDK